jgi:hypothetical protein
MVLFLLKHDDLFKAALVCIFLAPLVLLPGPDAVSGAGLLTSLGFVALFAAARLRLDRRTTYFEAGLPIAGRQLYLVRALASLAAVWLPIAAACLLIFAMRRNTGGPQAMALVRGAGVLTLATLLPLSVRLREAAIPGRVAACLWIGTVLGGAALWFVLPPLWHLACFVIAAGVLFVRACYSVPPSFQIAPVEPTHESRATRRESARPVWWTMLRSAKPWFALALAILGGWIGGSIQLTLCFLFLVFQRFIQAREGTRWLQPFPISPRTLLALTLATTVAPFAIGWALGMALHPENPIVGLGPAHRDEQNRFGTNVPLEFWRLAPAGKAPLVRAPWGETIQPHTISILGCTFYNPYTSSQTNSKPFIEWQFENASQAIHGRRIPQPEYYAAIDSKPPVRPGRDRENILTLGMLLFGLLAGTYLCELALCHCWKRTSAFGLKLLLIPMSLWMGCLALDMFYLFRENTYVIGPFCHALLSRLSTVLPQNLPAVALVAFLPSFLLYSLLEWQFTRSETTDPLIPRTVAGMEPQ